MPCPFCRSTDCHYSHRRFGERWLSKVILRRPFRCHQCRKRFWEATQGETAGGSGLRQHMAWVFSLLLALAFVVFYISNLPYKKREEGHLERSTIELPVGEGSSAEELESGRRLSEIRLTPWQDGLRLELFGATPLEHSTLRHFQVPDRLVLDLTGPWDPPAPPTNDLQHPLLDRVRLVERGIGLRLELLLRQTDVETSLEETEDGLVISVRPSS